MQAQPNIALNGDEARILLAALRTTNIAVPLSTALDLYLRLAMLSQVQPPDVPTGQDNVQGAHQ